MESNHRHRVQSAVYLPLYEAGIWSGWQELNLHYEHPRLADFRNLSP